MHKWHAVERSDNAYAARSDLSGGSRRYVLMHRVVMGAKDGEIVDHVDGDGLNNQRLNLRIATAEQNSWNRRGRGASRYIGVRKSPRGWVALIGYRGHEVYLGAYASEADAASTYDDAAARLYGSFARLNSAGGTSGLREAIDEKRAAVARLQQEISMLGGLRNECC